jgi:hypothetical protein
MTTTLRSVGGGLRPVTGVKSLLQDIINGARGA